MAVQIFWNNRKIDMSDAKALLKAEMLGYIMGTEESRTFIPNLNEAERKFDDSDYENYPEEDMEKMYIEFEKMLNEILEMSLDDVISQLPQKKYGNLAERVQERKEQIENKKLKDLLEGNTINMISGAGAYELGRKLEGLPMIDFFEEIKGQTVELDFVFKQRIKDDKSSFIITTTNPKNEEIHNITIGFSDHSTVRDVKEKALEKYGIYNAGFTEARKKDPYVVSKGKETIKFNLDLAEILKDGKLLPKGTLVELTPELDENGDHAFIEIDKDGKKIKKLLYKEIGKRTLKTKEYEEILERIKTQKIDEDIISIDDKPYRLIFNEQSRSTNITDWIEEDVNKFITDNMEKFQSALKPYLDDPLIVATGKVNLDIKTSITKVSGGKEVIEDIDYETYTLMEEEDLLPIVEEDIGYLKEDITIYEENLKLLNKTQKNIVNKNKPMRDRVMEYKSNINELKEQRENLRERIASQQKTSNSAKKIGFSDEETLRGYDKLIEEFSEVKELTKILNYIVREREEIKNKLEKTKSLLSSLEKYLKDRNISALQLMYREEKDKKKQPYEKYTTQEKYISRNPFQELSSFLTFIAEVKTKGLPIYYEVIVDSIGKIDINPSKYSRTGQKGRMKRSYDSEIADGLRNMVNKINRLKNEIGG